MTSAVAAWRQQAAAALERAREQDVNQAFAVCGKLRDMPVTAVTEWQVQGVADSLDFPLRADEVAKLLALGQPAPFGRNADTILDPAVRKALQVDASCVNACEEWHLQLQRLTIRVAAELGVDPQVTVEARPYKLLMYTGGGHFKAHKDTEKEAGMFGTLVVQLPVRGGHKGGNLVFQHHGKTLEWQTETSSSNNFQYAAFYADVEHELQPISSGTRVVMVYNLVRTGNGVAPQALDGSPVVKQLQEAIQSWDKDLTDGKAKPPRLLAVLLDHQYTESSLSFSALKGTDAKMVGCLNHPDVGLDVHLTLFTRTETYGDGAYDCDHCATDFSVKGCVTASGTQSRSSITELINLSDKFDERGIQLLDGGKPPVWADGGFGGSDNEHDSQNDDGNGKSESDQGNGESGSGDAKEGEDGQPKACKKRKPAQTVHNPYTGNDGATIDKIYHDTVAVIWPKTQATSLLGGHLESAQYLLRLRQAENDVAGAEVAAQQIVNLFAKPQTGTWPAYLGDLEDLTAVLQAISRLGTHAAVPALASVIAHLPTVGKAKGTYCSYNKENDKLRDSIIDSIMQHGSTTELLAALTKLVNGHAIASVDMCAELAVRAAVKSTALSSAVADAVLSLTLLAADAQQVLASMKASSICNLAVMLFKLPTHQHHLTTLATAVLALPDPQAVIKELLTAPEFSAAGVHLPLPVKTLVKARQEHLQQMIKPEPAFTWEMPGASVGEHSDVQAFLRGPEEKATFTFADYRKADYFIGDWFTDHSRDGWGWAPKRQKRQPTYTATATADSIFDAKVTIIKTRAWFEDHVKAHHLEQKKVQEDLACVEKLLKSVEDV